MPAASAPTRWLLKPLDLPHLPAQLSLAEGACRVGRDPSNDVVVPGGEYSQVSAHHARFSLRDGRVLVEDLGSTNGTLVNGRSVETRVLASGDTVQLGPGGPRFVALDPQSVRRAVAGPSGLGSTRFVPAPTLREEVPPGARLSVPVRRPLTLGLTALLVVVAAVGIVAIDRDGDAELERITRVSRQIQERLEGELVEASHRLDRQSEHWQSQRRDLARERDELQTRIARIESDGTASGESLERLRRELESTRQHLELFDPVAQEELRIAEIGKVRSAVVLIEKKVVYRDPGSGRLLHLAEDGAAGEPLSLGGAGEPLTLDSSTGSGFCVSPDGWILTNAHVLRFAGRRFPVRFDEEVELVAERQVEVVFTDESERRSAEVVRVVEEEGVDLALLRIEPFEDMPFVEGIDPAQAAPEPGGEVYLFGFPLGHHALQPHDAVVASTFKGILSRVVDPYLQVDAGVYPGNSGGPLTDVHGRVLGVIFSVQNNLDGTTAANIGYAIPVSRLGAVWPPSDEVAEAR